MEVQLPCQRNKLAFIVKFNLVFTGESFIELKWGFSPKYKVYENQN